MNSAIVLHSSSIGSDLLSQKLQVHHAILALEAELDECRSIIKNKVRGKVAMARRRIEDIKIQVSTLRCRAFDLQMGIDEDE